MPEDWIREIQNRIKKIPITSGGSKKRSGASFENLVFLPAQLKKRPVDYYLEKISSKTIVGKQCKKPIELETPIVFGAMSFGALSREAKISLAKAATMAGTLANTGEGGMLPQEREFSKYLIVQYSTARFGIDEAVLKKADAVEIKIGQGAKGGTGGFLPKEKVTREISQVRKVPLGKDIHSPAYHQDIKNSDDLKNKVDYLRKVTGGVPIILKMAAGELTEDLKIAVKANPDIIAIDGAEGGTGAAPEVMMEEMGLPTLAALAQAREVLNGMGAKQELWVGGGLRKGGDFAKALALGADAVFCGSPLLIAMGCIYCRQCYLGKCPLGIATHDEQLRKKLNIEEAAQKIAGYVKNSTEEIKMIVGACGENDIHKLNKGHLRTLNSDTAKITKVKMAGE